MIEIFNKADAKVVETRGCTLITFIIHEKLMGTVFRVSFSITLLFIHEIRVIGDLFIIQKIYFFCMIKRVDLFTK